MLEIVLTNGSRASGVVPNRRYGTRKKVRLVGKKAGDFKDVEVKPGSVEVKKVDVNNR